MSERPYITLIFPAFNEAATIVSTIEETARYFQSRAMTYQIVVAADGDDGTRERVRERFGNDAAVDVIGHRERRGKGRGIREAVAISLGSIIGYADADRKVPIQEYDRLDPWFAKGYQLVIGTRAMAESIIERYQPWYRRIGSKGFHWAMNAIVGLPAITDSQCGFKFFRAETAREIFAHQRIDGYMFDVEILAMALRAGYRIHQVPIRWRDDGDSRLDLLRGNLQNLRDLVRIRLNAGRWNGKL